ncbi:MAG: tetratricopeptide repeat protein [Desulfobacterales bacterium]|nr:tetratricopeptide repeat protein [Desulfobacterales bacterium]
MATKDFKRKLSAILSADVAGYSRLMGEDEAATVSTLEIYREVMSTLIKQHRGRVVDSPGDNVLAEFASVVDAVQCGVAVQNEFQARNAELPENRRMQFRIGINLGDVIEEGDRIYGDGVNIAARLEALANPGGICISKTAFDHIETKLPLGYEYLGDQTVKNITKPVGAYRVLMEPRVTVAGEKEKAKLVPFWRKKAILAGGVALVLVVIAALIWNFYFRPPPMEVASVERMAFPLPDKPSIAVLPFDNLTGDKDQEYFSDGITEEIITALSKTPKMLVIARNSTFSYKGKTVKVNQVAEELGVRYVLEGSVRKAGDRVRITAQLIDGLTGHHLWAERYDRDLKDIFALQDEITIKIISALQVKLTDGELAGLAAKGTDNLEAYIKCIQARELIFKTTKEGNRKAQQLLEEALAIDPKYFQTYRLLGGSHLVDIWLGLSKSPRESLKRAIQSLQQAVSLNESSGTSYSTLGYAYVLARLYDKAIAAAERGLALEPSSADVLFHYALILTFADRREEAIPYFREALRLNPMPPNTYLRHLGIALRDSGQYEEAIALQKKAIQEEPNDILAYLVLASSYGLAGREEEAQAAAKEVLRINPKFSVAQLEKISPHKDRTVVKRFCDALRKAGLPETPPLPLPDKPSIAVLPFANMSDDPKQEYFSDGLTEEIINALSKVSKLFVIARNSTFTYKGKPVKVQQVGRELGVRYVLEGSVRKAGYRVRITAQLIDATTGHHLWSDRYDRDLKDIFALQDEITMKIISAMQVELTEGEQAQIAAGGTANLDVYLKVLEARDLARHQNIEDNLKARQILKEALELDPHYARAYRWLSGTHYMDVWLGSTKSPRESLKIAAELSKKALSIDNSLGDAHGLLGNIYVITKQYEKGIPELEKAVDLEPNGADAHAHLAMGLLFMDRSEEAILMSKKAIRLSPIAPSWYLHNLAATYRNIRNYEESLVWAEKAVKQEPENILSHLVLCSIYSIMGRMEEARVEANEVKNLNPKFSLIRFEKTLPYKNLEAKNRYIEALSKAGLE